MVAALFALLGLAATLMPASGSMAATNSAYFAETGYNVAGAMLTYWQAHGGVKVLGYPISRTVTSDGRTMQYFERARLEQSASVQTSLALLGSMLTADQKFPKVIPFKNNSKQVYFKETGHSLSNRFLAFWQAGGGLSVFGYPISEPQDVGGKTVQWFERARFEWDSRQPNTVTLGLLGREYLAAHPVAGTALAPDQPKSEQPLLPPTGLSNPKWQALPGAEQLHWHGWCTWFSTDWSNLIYLNEKWGNLPHGYKGEGMYAAIPEDTTEQWHLYGHWVRISYKGNSVDAQLIDVIAYRDIPGVRSRGIVVDLSKQVFAKLAPLEKGMLQLDVQVLP